MKFFSLILVVLTPALALAQSAYFAGKGNLKVSTPGSKPTSFPIALLEETKAGNATLTFHSQLIIGGKSLPYVYVISPKFSKIERFYNGKLEASGPFNPMSSPANFSSELSLHCEAKPCAKLLMTVKTGTDRGRHISFVTKTNKREESFSVNLNLRQINLDSFEAFKKAPKKFVGGSKP